MNNNYYFTKKKQEEMPRLLHRIELRRAIIMAFRQ